MTVCAAKHSVASLPCVEVAFGGICSVTVNGVTVQRRIAQAVRATNFFFPCLYAQSQSLPLGMSFCYAARSACSTLDASSEASVAGADACPLCLYTCVCTMFVLLQLVHTLCSQCSEKKKKILALFTASHSLPSTPQPGPCNAPHFRKNIDLAMKKRNTSNRYNSLNGDYSSDRILKNQKIRKLEKIHENDLTK